MSTLIQILAWLTIFCSSLSVMATIDKFSDPGGMEATVAAVVAAIFHCLVAFMGLAIHDIREMAHLDLRKAVDLMKNKPPKPTSPPPPKKAP